LAGKIFIIPKSSSGFYQALDLLCLPSRADGLPWQAQACGAPAILTNENRWQFAILNAKCKSRFAKQGRSIPKQSHKPSLQSLPNAAPAFPQGLAQPPSVIFILAIENSLIAFRLGHGKCLVIVIET
jgi:hypothetical protein